MSCDFILASLLLLQPSQRVEFRKWQQCVYILFICASLEYDAAVEDDEEENV